MEDLFLVVFALGMIILMIFVFVWEFQSVAEQRRNDVKLKKTSGYNKNLSGEIKNICRNCGKTWFYDQDKINTLTENVLAGRHAMEVGAMASASNWASGRGNTAQDWDVLRSNQLSGMSTQAQTRELESLRKCPNCNSNNAKRMPASSSYAPKFKTKNDEINIENKLEKIKNLYKKKLIDESDYKEMKTKLLSNINFDEVQNAEIIDKGIKSKRYFHCSSCNFKSINPSKRCPNCMGPDFGR